MCLLPNVGGDGADDEVLVKFPILSGRDFGISLLLTAGGWVLGKETYTVVATFLLGKAHYGQEAINLLFVTDTLLNEVLKYGMLGAFVGLVLAVLSIKRHPLRHVLAVSALLWLVSELVPAAPRWFDRDGIFMAMLVGSAVAFPLRRYREKSKEPTPPPRDFP